MNKRYFLGVGKPTICNLETDQELSHFFLKKKNPIDLFGEVPFPLGPHKGNHIPIYSPIVKPKKKNPDGEHLLLTKFFSELGVNFTFAPIDD